MSNDALTGMMGGELASAGAKGDSSEVNLFVKNLGDALAAGVAARIEAGEGATGRRLLTLAIPKVSQSQPVCLCPLTSFSCVAGA